MTEVLHRALQTKTLTHVYASCGFLPQSQPRYRFTHLPAARSVFDLASLTKALVTLPLYTHAALSGKLSFASPVASLLQDSEHELCDALAQLRIADLLAHRSGLPAWRNFWIGMLGKTQTLTTADTIALLNRSATHLQNRQPHYSDLNYILAGICLEIWQKKSLATLFSEFYRTQLHYAPRLCFGFCPVARERTVPSAYCQIRKRLLQGEVHDENCAAHGGVSGHAGLFASGDDLVAYLRTLFTHAVGREILRHNKNLLASTTSPQLLGMQRGANGVLSAQGTLLGHLGFTGVSFWLDLRQDSYQVLLSNRTINARLVPHFHTLRQQVYRTLQEKLADSSAATK